MSRPWQPVPTFSGHLNHPAAHKRRLLYARLCELAERGEPCPGNAVLARVAGYRSDSGVTGALSILVDEGLIVRRLAGHLRVITIAATGLSTAEPQRPPEPPYAYTPKRPVREIAEVAIAMSGLSARHVLGRSRYAEHVRVRQVIACMATREGWGSAHIGRALGFDHTTILHARRVLPAYAAREPETAELVARLADALPPLPERMSA